MSVSDMQVYNLSIITDLVLIKAKALSLIAGGQKNKDIK